MAYNLLVTPPSDIATAFTAARRELERLVGRFVRRNDIEDIVQEAFVRSFEAELQHPIEHPRAFMLKTAKHLALNYTARSEQRLVDSIEDFPDPDQLRSDHSVERQHESREHFLMFCRAVRQLPAQCRRAFILKKVYGLSQREIASYLGISESTVEKHVAKGILECSRYLTAAGFPMRDTRKSAGKVRRA